MRSEEVSHLEELFDRFPEVPKEVILKETLLVNGIKFTDKALEKGGEYQEKAYYLFTFDKDEPSIVRKRARVIPQEISVWGGPWGLRRTVIQGRHSERSPFLVDVEDERTVLRVGESRLADVSFAPKPQYYGSLLTSGLKVEEVAPAIYWGETVDVTVFRVCEYWGKEQCKFCDINENFKWWGDLRSGLGTKVNPELVAEAVYIAFKSPNTKRYLITGGAMRNQLEESQFYLNYVRRTEELLAGRLPLRLNVQAVPTNILSKFYEAGVDYYHPNIEVWDSKLFSMICPGKDRVVGRDEWIRRTIDSVKLFGVGNVSPNFVAGVEAVNAEGLPRRFEKIDEALRSTAEGLDFLMSREVVPKFDTWAPEPGSILGRLGAKPPSVEYYVKLYLKYHEIRKRYGLPYPGGLGEGGPGVSKVPASGFMDM